MTRAARLLLGLAAMAALFRATSATLGAGSNQVLAASASPERIWVMLLIGLVGIGAVAIIGTAWVILGGRRDADDDEESREPEATPAQVTVEQIIAERTVRRARMQPSDDPILASMGLGQDGHRQPGRPSPRQVTVVPDERAGDGATPPRRR